MTSTIQYVHLPSNSQTNQAHIFLIANELPDAKTHVIDNGREIGEIGQCGYLAWQQRPGPILLYCKEWDADEKEGKVCHAFQAESGKCYYLKVERTDKDPVANMISRRAAEAGIVFAVFFIFAIAACFGGPGYAGGGWGGNRIRSDDSTHDTNLVKLDILLSISVLTEAEGRELLRMATPPVLPLRTEFKPYENVYTP